MMLEVKNLKKVYKIKKADPVPALDDVSLKFPDTGLVFILGKSGSGKSTLLNVMGGLDVADSGEIVINGKSSKDFDASEMDSYRNTYLGFIFQEYNILSDFTVRENIALALELQHKKPTDEVINGILEEVDLVGYGKRKPNELSGGQKQRVAIARALVKEPKILFGDEPTGALDSATGLAVFETLKKLSKTRLVVIVSHDREFAERFGDRVIELKDGKVISDITKITEDTDETESGVSLYGSNLIKFEKGHKLTKEDIDLINRKLASTDEDAYFSIDSRINDSVSYAAMINENGQKESFIETDNENVEQKKEKWRVVKSKFPMSAAFRMGAKSLRVKPFRLVMTILLSFIAFAMFGLAVTFARVNKVSATVNSLEKSDEQVVVFTKGGWGDSRFGESFKIDIEGKTGVGFDVVGRFESGLYNNTTKAISNQAYYAYSFYGCVVISADKAQKYGVSLMSGGSYPTGLNEICISKDMYNTFKEYGIKDGKDNSKKLNPEDVTETSILGYYLSDYNNNFYKIVGIIDTGLDMSPYDQLKNAKETDLYNNQDIQNLASKLQNARQTGLHCMAFVSPTYFEKNVVGKSNYYRFEDEWNTGRFGVTYEQDGNERKETVMLFTDDAQKAFFNASKTELGKDEILIDIERLISFLQDFGNYQMEEDTDMTQQWTFNTVFTGINESYELVSPYQANMNWQHAYSIVYEMDEGDYSDTFEYLTKYIYAQNYYNSYKTYAGTKRAPYTEEQLFNRYNNYYFDYYYNNMGYDWSDAEAARDQMMRKIFKTQSAAPDTYELDTNGYHIIDIAKLQTFISDAEYGADIFFIDVFNYLCDCYTSDRYDSVVAADFETYKTQAKQLVKEVIVDQYPNAKNLRDIQRYAGYDTNDYAKVHFEEFFEEVKDNTELLDAFRKDRGNQTLVITTDSDKQEYMRWYLDLFTNKWSSVDSSVLDSKWFDAYRKAKIDNFAKAVTDGNININDINVTFTYRVNTGNGEIAETTYTKKVVGVFNRDYNVDAYNYPFYMQRSEIEEFGASKMDLNYSRLFAAKPTNNQVLTKIVSLYYDSYEAYDKIPSREKTNADYYYNLQSPLVSSIMMWVSLLGELEQIFLYVGIAMAAFAMLLFYNFLSISINNKRHEIGILRAVGARGVDVFKIFYSESAIIAFINFVLATASLIAVGIVLNAKIGEAIPGLVLLSVGFVEILLVFAVALVSSILSSLLPVIKIARQKPIDAIREK